MSGEHHHSHAVEKINSAFKIGIILNLIYVAVELAVGLSINSMALVSDAGHNFSDVLSLALAWVAAIIAKSPPTQRRTYGMRKATILASFLNSLLLLVAIGAIAVETVRNFSKNESLPGDLIMITAAIGVVINGLTALLFMKEKGRDINVRGAFLHMVADAAISLGVVLAGFLINITGLFFLDSIVSSIIIVLIFIGTWRLLKESFMLSMDAVPPGINPKDVASYFQSINGVIGVHDLHIWSISSLETALTVHLVVNSAAGDAITDKLQSDIKAKFGIGHSTIQIELDQINASCLYQDI